MMMLTTMTAPTFFLLSLSLLTTLSTCATVSKGNSRPPSTPNPHNHVRRSSTASSSSSLIYSYSTTANDLVNGTCAPIVIIYARGTLDPGNLGGSVGPPFFNALAEIVGASNLCIQGVEYPDQIWGFAHGGSPEGSRNMAALVAQAATQCPDSKIVMSGYSQGGQLVHNAADMLNDTLTDAVNSVVIFGDPYNGTAVGNISATRVLTVCHSGDDVCRHEGDIQPAHLNYSGNAVEAATFVAGLANLSNATITEGKNKDWQIWGSRIGKIFEAMKVLGVVK